MFSSGSAEIAVEDAELLTRGRIQSLYLKQMKRSDHFVLDRVREVNRAWLEPWDATSPHPEEIPSFALYVHQMTKLTREGKVLPLLIIADGKPAGQITVGDITHGAAWSASVGYWIARDWAGYGITTAALAATIDHCFSQLQLHRIEICIRPENDASLAVVRKLGLREEGYRYKYLHINGSWADHRCFAILDEELPEGGLSAMMRKKALGS